MPFLRPSPLLLLLCLFHLLISHFARSQSLSTNNTTNTTNTAQQTNTTTPTTPTNTTTSTNATNATNATSTTPTSSLLSSLHLSITKPGRGSPIMHTVYTEHALSAVFSTCPSAVQAGTTNATNCFIDDAYNDRLSFTMSFSDSSHTLQTIFDNHPPAITILNPSSSTPYAAPNITSVSVNAQDSTASLQLVYRCARVMQSVVVALKLSLRFGQGDDELLDVIWAKRCVDGENEQLQFGYLAAEQENTEPVAYEFPRPAHPGMVVRPSDVSTELFLKVDFPGAQQMFLAPYVTSKEEEVTPVEIRGNHPAGGVLKGLERVVFQINYHCRKSGKSQIMVTIAIPPWNNLTAMWEKDCGGGVPRMLQIGTKRHISDVVRDGVPQPEYKVSIDHIGQPHSDAHLHLPGNVSDWQIYLSVYDMHELFPGSHESGLHIGRITTTVEKTSVMVSTPPKLATERIYGWATDTKAEHILSVGDNLRVSFHFICRTIGEGRVLISVPVLQYGTLEFGIAKECTHVGQAHRSREMVWTVGKVFWVAVGSIVVFLAATWWRRRRATMAGFKKVATIEG